MADGIVGYWQIRVELQTKIIVMRNSFIYTFILFFALFCFHSSAQKKVERVEMETKLRSENYRVVPMGKFGAVMFAQDKPSILSNFTSFHFSHFDTALKMVWEKEIEISNWTDLEGYDADGSNLYLLFHRYNGDAYDFCKVDTKSQKVEIISRFSVKKLEFESIKVMNGNAFVSGIVRKTPVLLHFDLNTNDKSKVKILPTSSTKKAEIEFLDKDTVNNLMSFSYTNWRGNEATLVLQSFEPNGRMASEIALPNSNGKNLLSGKQSISNEGNAVLVGTYANGKSKLSDGLYIAEFDGATQKYIKFYNFADLENFLNYLPKKKRARIERKKEKKKSKDKDLDLQYRLLVHNLIFRDNHYILMAEAYYPTYRYVNNNYGVGGFQRNPYSRSPYGVNRYGTNSQQVFDGFQYTHAFLASFDNKGNLEWDNSFELDNVKLMRLKEVVKVNVELEKIKVLYAFQGKLLSQIIEGGKVAVSKQEQLIETAYETDRVTRNLDSDLAYWFDNYFIAWGYQRIKNNTGESEKSKRNVFFFNKVPF